MPIFNQLCIVTILTIYHVHPNIPVYLSVKLCIILFWRMSSDIGSDFCIFISPPMDSQIDSWMAPKSKVHYGYLSFWQKAMPQPFFTVYSHDGSLDGWVKAALCLYKIQSKDAMLDKSQTKLCLLWPNSAHSIKVYSWIAV